jgi:amicyanin
VKIKIADLAFDPPTVTVRAGTKVTWTNQDEVPHTVTSTTKPRVLESPALDTNDSFSHVFKEPGTYKYFCTVHPKMAGTVVVK